MRKALVLVSLLLLAISLPATTVKGKTNPNKDVMWFSDLADPVGGTQVTVTLEWTKAGADLVLGVLCDIGIAQFFGASFGTSADRFQRVEAGVVGNFCGFFVSSLKGASKFKMMVLDWGDPVLTKRTGSRGLGRLIRLEPGDWPDAVEKMKQLKAFHRRASGAQ